MLLVFVYYEKERNSIKFFPDRLLRLHYEFIQKLNSVIMNINRFLRHSLTVQSSYTLLHQNLYRLYSLILKIMTTSKQLSCSRPPQRFLGSSFLSSKTENRVPKTNKLRNRKKKPSDFDISLRKIPCEIPQVQFNASYSRSSVCSAEVILLTLTLVAGFPP